MIPHACCAHGLGRTRLRTGLCFRVTPVHPSLLTGHCVPPGLYTGRVASSPSVRLLQGNETISTSRVGTRVAREALRGSFKHGSFHVLPLACVPQILPQTLKLKIPVPVHTQGTAGSRVPKVRARERTATARVTAES